MQRGLQPGQVPILGKLIFAEGFEQRFDARLVKPVGQKSRQRLRRGVADGKLEVLVVRVRNCQVVKLRPALPPDVVDRPVTQGLIWHRIGLCGDRPFQVARAVAAQDVLCRVGVPARHEVGQRRLRVNVRQRIMEAQDAPAGGIEGGECRIAMAERGKFDAVGWLLFRPGSVVETLAHEVKQRFRIDPWKRDRFFPRRSIGAVEEVAFHHPGSHRNLIRLRLARDALHHPAVGNQGKLRPCLRAGLTGLPAVGQGIG